MSRLSSRFKTWSAFRFRADVHGRAVHDRFVPTGDNRLQIRVFCPEDGRNGGTHKEHRQAEQRQNGHVIDCDACERSRESTRERDCGVGRGVDDVNHYAAVIVRPTIYAVWL